MRSIALLLLILITVSGAFAQGWEWQNTVLQGNNLTCITFTPDGQSGWATSTAGDVLASTDGGGSWSVGTTIWGLGLDDVVFTDSVRGWGMSIVNHSIEHTTDGGLTWTIQYTMPGGWLQDINFVDSHNGWAVGAGAILHTSDGGDTWDMQDSLSGTQLSGVSFVSAQESWVAGTKMLHTINGGTTWTTIAQDCPVNGKIQFFQGGRGWALQSPEYYDSCFVLRTTDNGLSWTPQMYNGDTIRTLVAFDFANDSTGWAVGSGGDIFHTSNGGASWSRQTSGTSGRLIGVKATNHLNAWVAGDGGLILRTTDGGAHWFPQAGNPSTAAINLRAVQFADTLHGWAAGSHGMVLRTTNGGGDWTPMSTGVSFELKHIAVLDPQTVWVAGESDSVPHTTDGGASWNTFVADNTHPWNYGTPLIAHAGSDHLWILADSVYRSTDGGTSWTGHEWESSTSLPYPTGFLFSDENTGWICTQGDQGGGSILRTGDGGVTWSEVYLGDPALFGLTFINADTGWVITEYGTIQHTTDSGSTWAELSDPPAFGGGCLQFTDALTGWITVNESYYQGDPANFLHTTDGGVTWQGINGPCGNGMFGMHFSDANHGWAVGRNGAIVAFHRPLASSPREAVTVISASYTLSSYPNPFNPTTVLSFDVPQSSRVTLSVYDITGRLVQTLADRMYPQGSYRVTFDGASLPSGMYFVRMQAKDFSKTQKLVLLK